MNLPQIHSTEELATDVVVSVINAAKSKIGRATLHELAESHETPLITLKRLVPPIAVSIEPFLREAIEKQWRLTETFKYTLRDMGTSKDEIAQYFYYEAIFSQPTVNYPIPQATVSVFFRFQEKQLEPNEQRGAPIVTFHLEGQTTEYDVRRVRLIPDMILAILQMKLQFFKRVENIQKF